MPSRLQNVLITTVLLGALVAAWEAAVTVFAIPLFVLPPPSEIVVALAAEWDIFLHHTRVTAQEIVVGFVAGSLLGLVLAFVMTLFGWLRNTLYPLVIASQTIPKVAIAPLLVIWFGVGMLPKVLVVALLAFFPVLINAMVGLQNVDRNLIALMRSVDASVWQVYWRVRLPAALPHIFAGLKLAITISVVGAIVGEWVAAQEGLGYLLLYYNSILAVPQAFAGVLVLIILGVVSFLAIVLLERKLSWSARTGHGSVSTTEPGM